LRAISKIILHCSASDSDTQTAAVIDQWHKERGWAKIGYHYFIRKNGLIESGRAVEEIGAHVHGQNSDSLGICVAGLKHFEPTQFESLQDLLLCLRRIWPDASIHGHNEFDKNKECPVYDVVPFKKMYKTGERQWKISSDSLWKMLLKLLKRA